MIGPINQQSPLRHLMGTPTEEGASEAQIGPAQDKETSKKKTSGEEDWNLVDWLKDNAEYAMLIIPTAMVLLAATIITIIDHFRRGGEDPDGDDEKQPRLPMERFVNPFPTIRDIEPVDTKETANTFLKRFRARGPDGLPSGCMKLIKDTMPTELSQLTEEAKDLLASATIEADINGPTAMRALTAYLARFWERWGLRADRSGPSMKRYMIAAQDSLARGFFQQAAAAHMRILNAMDRDDGLNELEVEVALQLHRLTAGMLEYETYKDNNDNPELARAHLDTARKLLSEEQFELFTPSLRTYALIQKARVIPPSKAYSIAGSGLPAIARTVMGVRSRS